MTVHPGAGKPADPSDLVDVPKLLSAYHDERPDPGEIRQRVSFGTSGHRGCALDRTFNEDHVLAIVQAVCDYRKAAGIDGPLFLGRDTHALSTPAEASAVEVLAANGVDFRVDRERGPTPTPAVSHAILGQNRGRDAGLADGVVITPSHNPPRDGGLKYNPPSGGPAGGETTKWIEERSNEILAGGNADVRREVLERARGKATPFDYVGPYVKDLENAVDLGAVRASGLRIGVDPMGGAGIGYWGPIAEAYGLDITVVNEVVDPTFRFMTLDRDGKIRMDCSSPWAMAGLIDLRDRFDVAFGNDTDYDRHGIVTPGTGLLPPNHYLAVCVRYLFERREGWPRGTAVGKTVVSSSMIDRVVADLGRGLVEVPVGFKWFVEGLLDGSLGFVGEESAGAAFLRRDGTVWTTDKDGILLDLLAAEVTAVLGKDPGEVYRELTERFGEPVYERIDSPIEPELKAALLALTPDRVEATELAGEPIEAILTEAPGNGASLGGLKVVSENGWFAVRPSGTENVSKIYAESFLGRDHLRRIQEEAGALLDATLRG